MRKRQYRDLPSRLYWNGTTFVYRRPDGKSVSLGTNKRAAIEAATRANLIFDQSADRLVGQIMGEAESPIGDILERYFREYVVPRNGEKTLADYRHKHKVLKKHWGQLYPAMLTVRLVADFVDQFPPRQSQRYAQYLRRFFRWAVSKGYLEKNLASDIITKDYKVQRERLTLSAYKAVRAEADPWFQRAMDLALQSLQRREDLSLLKFEDYRDGILPVPQQKTGVIVHISAGPELDRAIRACRDDVLSPFIVHRKPERITAKSRARREHHTQVLPEQLTRAFAEARDRTDLVWEKGTAPSFHEIRALGAKLYEKAGIDPQPLLGHKDAQTTKIYLGRHEVEVIEAAAGLKV